MPTYDKWIDPIVEITPHTSAYTAGFVVGDHANATTGAMIFDLAGSSSGGGMINMLKVWDDDNEGAAGALWLFKQDLTTPILDFAAFAPVYADYANWIMTITLGTFTGVNSIKSNMVEDINNKFQVTKNRLYGYFVCSGTPTFASSKHISFQLGILTQ